MATTATTLVQRTRRFLRDWPESDISTASMSSGTTTLTVADSTLYPTGSLIQIETEGMVVRAQPSGTTVTVFRGARGSTAASHVTASTVLVRPRFLDMDYLDALNAGINATFPWIYQPTSYAYDGVISTVYEYEVPLLNGYPIPYISKIQFKETGDTAYRDFQAWQIMPGTVPFIKLRRTLPSGSLRIEGFAPIPPLTGLTDSLSALFPVNAEDALTMFAAQYLLASGEAARVREDTGARDQRENANRVGGSLSLSNSVFQRFQRRIMDSGMPPMPKHIVSVL